MKKDRPDPHSEDEPINDLAGRMRQRLADQGWGVRTAEDFNGCCGNPASCVPANGPCETQAAYMAHLKESDLKAYRRESVRYALAGPERWALPRYFRLGR